MDPFEVSPIHKFIIMCAPTMQEFNCWNYLVFTQLVVMAPLTSDLLLSVEYNICKYIN